MQKTLDYYVTVDLDRAPCGHLHSDYFEALACPRRGSEGQILRVQPTDVASGVASGRPATDRRHPLDLIHATAIVADSARIGENVRIGAYAIVGEGVVVTDGGGVPVDVGLAVGEGVALGEPVGDGVGDAAA